MLKGKSRETDLETIQLVKQEVIVAWTGMDSAEAKRWSDLGRRLVIEAKKFTQSLDTWI